MRCFVLEADTTHVGGISRTAGYKGFLVDIGGHRFFSKSKEVVDLWNEILPDDFIERPRLSRIYYGSKFYSYPLRAFEALKNLGLIESTLCMASFGWAKLFPVKNPRTFHQWVRNQFGERLFSIFFRTYTEKVWGMSCDDISADWAAQRIKGLSLMAAVIDGLRRSLGVTNKKAAAKTLIESFRYPRKGPGMMWEACAAKIAALGGTTLMGRQVTGLRWDAPSQLWIVTAKPQTAPKRSIRPRTSFPPRRSATWRARRIPRRPRCRTRGRIGVPRLSHRRANGQVERRAAGQLGLHPRLLGQGRTFSRTSDRGLQN